MWVVSDAESPHHPFGSKLKEAEQKLANLKKHNICVCVSAPCFEFWFLLHFIYTTRDYSDCNNTMKELKQHWTDYTKSSSCEEVTVEDRVDEAIKNAQQLWEHLNQADADRPKTDVDLVVTSIRQGSLKQRSK